MIELAKVSSSYKRQSLPLLKDVAPHQETRNCLTVSKNLILSSSRGLDTERNWPTDRWSQRNFDFYFYISFALFKSLSSRVSEKE
jgi:hypothetical protein